MTPRVSDWEPRLSAFLSDGRAQEHSYGRWDCLIFVAGVVKALTGVDLARGHRRKYRSAASASRYLRELGFESPAAMVSAHLPTKPIAFAQRGDIVADESGVPGVCIGHVAVFVGEGDGEPGLVRKPRSAWSQAWGV